VRGDVVSGPLGRVIKGYGHVVPAIVMDARAEAAALLEAARREADVARAEIAALQEASRRAGYDEGRAQAGAELAGVLASAHAEAERMLADVQPAALAIAAKMAEKIVGRAVALDPGVMGDIAAEAVAACRTRGGVVLLRVHPDDLAGVEARRRAIAERLGGEGTLQIVVDDSVTRHGCVVDTAVGRVDARLEAQLAALTKELRG
jgi:flagellar biosynthesis/type III secretory pathway protein FliH